MRPHLATLEEAEAALRSGALACFPTETLWSLSCRADRPAAVRTVFAVKRRELAFDLLHDGDQILLCCEQLE